MTNKTWGRVSALLCAIVLVTAGCGRLATSARHDGSPPPNVKGDPMEPMPTTRQQAQDAVYRYYQKTLRELPEGYALDNSRYGAVGATVVSCNDDAPDQNVAPAQYSDERTVLAPSGTNFPDLVAKIGEIWKKWGWRVEEDRKGFNKPNRFATAPDGYRLSVESDSQYPIVFTGSSPCFPGDKSRYEPIPIPTIITRDGPQYRN